MIKFGGIAAGAIAVGLAGYGVAIAALTVPFAVRCGAHGEPTSSITQLRRAAERISRELEG